MKSCSLRTIDQLTKEWSKWPAYFRLPSQNFEKGLVVCSYHVSLGTTADLPACLVTSIVCVLRSTGTSIASWPNILSVIRAFNSIYPRRLTPSSRFKDTDSSSPMGILLALKVETELSERLDRLCEGR